MRQTLALVLLAVSLSASAQEVFTERIDVSAIDVPVVVRDRNGNVPADLTPSDFVITEDGIEQEIIGLAYPERASLSIKDSEKPFVQLSPVAPRARWQIVVFIQQSLSSSFGLRMALRALSARSEELTAMGDVEIVGDKNGTPRKLLASTGSATAVASSLRSLARTIGGSEQITRLRQQYLEDRAPLQGDMARAVATARIEAMILRARQESVLQWLTRYGSSTRPRALILVTNGYDTDPRDFYKVSDPVALADLDALSAAPQQRQIAEAVAAAGWTVLSLAPGWMDAVSSPTFDVGNSGRGRLTAFSRGLDIDAQTPPSISVHPLDPLRTMAQVTGGSVLTSNRRLAAELLAISNRIVLTYQLHRRRDGRAHRIVVKSRRPDLSVRSGQWVVTGTPEALASMRASALTAEGGDRGELPVVCALRRNDSSSASKGQQSELDIDVDLTPLNAIRSSLVAATLRFSVVVQTKDAYPLTVSKRLDGIDLSREATKRVTFHLLHRPGVSVGVVAEEVATGAWGGCTCDETPVSDR